MQHQQKTPPRNPLDRAPKPDGMMILEFVVPQRFALLGDENPRDGRFEIEVDASRTVEVMSAAGGATTVTHPPVLKGRGPTAHVVQKRVTEVSVERGERITLPFSRLPDLWRFVCSECAAALGERRARYCREDEHRKAGFWKVDGSVRLAVGAARIFEADGVTELKFAVTPSCAKVLADEQRVRDGADPAVLR